MIKILIKKKKKPSGWENLQRRLEKDKEAMKNARLMTSFFVRGKITLRKCCHKICKSNGFSSGLYHLFMTIFHSDQNVSSSEGSTSTTTTVDTIGSETIESILAEHTDVNSADEANVAG